MKFIELARVFDSLEKTSSGNSTREILSQFFKKVSKEEIRIVCYFTLGTIASPYDNVVLGIADQMMIKTISVATNKEIGIVKNDFQNLGDLGLVSQKEEQAKKATLNVVDVYNILHAISKTTGRGSQEKKIELLSTILQKATPLESKYIVRIALGTLRMGVGDMTVLDSLALAFTDDKKNKKILEDAYNVCPDVGIIATKVAENLSSVKKIKPVIGRPIKVMLAQRVKQFNDIQKRMPNGIAVEEKYDGERVQIHKKGSKVILYSRRMDNITSQFPDIVYEIKKIKHDFICEGEIMPIDDKGNLLSFQTLMTRKRKHNIDEFVKKIPVIVFVFDLLYANKKSLLSESYLKRQAELKKILPKKSLLKQTNYIITKDMSEVEDFFSKCVAKKAEGIMAKNVEGSYQAGTRGFNWIKWKKDYTHELRDTFDLVIIGGLYGKGKRKNVYGAVLCAAYNKKTDQFESVCKLGSGFSDEQLIILSKKLKISKAKPKQIVVTKLIKPDVWFEPMVVVEVTGAELTRSPLHTAGTKEGKGIALRFPRFVRFRDDKNANQATTSKEIEELL